MRKSLVGLLITAVACLFATLFFQLGPFQRLESTISDYHFRLRGQTPVDNRLALVLVDPHTVKKYGYPFSRRFFAIVAKALANAGAKVIAFDFIFDVAPQRAEWGDLLLRRVSADNQNLVHAWNAELQHGTAVPVIPEAEMPSAIEGLPLISGLYSTTGNIHLPYPALLKDLNAMGLISVKPSDDGTIRRIPLLVQHRGRNYPSFALMIACRALDVSPVEIVPGKYLRLSGDGGEMKIPTDTKGEMIVNYTGNLMSFAENRFSFHDVYESIMSNDAIVPLSTFKDKVVIIGMSDPASGDICSTPYDNLFPGVGVHGMAVHTILQRRFLSPAPRLLNGLMLLVFIISTVAVTLHFRPWISAMTTGVLMISLWFISHLSFNQAGMILNFGPPATGILLSFFGTFLYGYMGEIQRGKALRETFEKHVSVEVMQELMRQGERIGVVERTQATVLFSDIKDSVSWAESLKSEPERLIEELNEYFAEMVDVIFRNGGTLLQFVGDGLIVVYGVPLERSTPALDAVRTGIEMQHRMEGLNQKRKAAGNQPLQIRVGINTGDVVMGNIGAERRKEYTAMGDTVNVAQRTEGQCEPGRVAMTETTYQAVKAHVAAEPMGQRQLKGKREPVMLYHVASLM